MPTPPLPTPGLLTRRSVLAGIGAVGASLVLAGCASPGGPRRTDITFYQTKPEAIGYFSDLVERFNESQSSIRVSHDTTSGIAAGFVRGNPPDVAAFTYNLEMARFMERGALSDLGDMPEASTIRPAVRELVDQYATYPGRTSVLPYSITAASVIYDREAFRGQGLEVPTTWTELLAVADALRAGGVDPLYSTFREPWTVAQGLFDYTTGGSLDVADFFARMGEAGTEVGEGAGVSFERDFAEPVDRMLQLAAYSNRDASSRGYGDGNLAMAEGRAGMLMQGPWALAEIAKTAPDADLGTFPLPMTEDAADRRVRVNLDLALWIPESSAKKEAAREFLSFLMTPEIQDAYNEEFLAFGTTTSAPPVTDPRIVDMQAFYDDGAFYQGASKSVPLTIPTENYVQGIVTGQDAAATLRTMDADWRRLASRT
ncbi:MULTISPECIES: ABC transporter substrate-binding protein [Clavibacter]|uniref:ABC transporter substrate-binding protein n=1 Tax=Clavibacter TaxID=1573 RepID=UPI000AEBBD80|nr:MULTISPECIES: extracellular solute-binding protein [Clavibacter]MDA3803583.1 extracellular solute-binding protein [Clavibacter sp. CT19]